MSGSDVCWVGICVRCVCLITRVDCWSYYYHYSDNKTVVTPAPTHRSPAVWVTQILVLRMLLIVPLCKTFTLCTVSRCGTPWQKVSTLFAPYLRIYALHIRETTILILRQMSFTLVCSHMTDLDCGDTCKIKINRYSDSCERQFDCHERALTLPLSCKREILNLYINDTVKLLLQLSPPPQLSP